MTSKRIAIIAFLVGLPTMLVAPFAVGYGILYILEATGVYRDPFGAPTDWGLGGILYCFGIPVWLGYLWAARSNTKSNHLKTFWRVSTALNTVWVVFFFLTLLRPTQLSSPVEVWIIYAIFPTIQLLISFKGVRITNILRTT
jgi:hypothetical protein